MRNCANLYKIFNKISHYFAQLTIYTFTAIVNKWTYKKASCLLSFSLKLLCQSSGLFTHEHGNLSVALQYNFM
jgi:hypothetical protein